MITECVSKAVLALMIHQVLVCQKTEVRSRTENVEGLFSGTVWNTSSSKGKRKKIGFVT